MTLFEWPRSYLAASSAPSCGTGDGQRPVYGGTRLFQDDPHWCDLVLFYEYFHGITEPVWGPPTRPAGPALVARLIQFLGQFDAETLLQDRQWPMARRTGASPPHRCPMSPRLAKPAA